MLKKQVTEPFSMSQAEANYLKRLCYHQLPPNAQQRLEEVYQHYLRLGLAIVRQENNNTSRAMAIARLEQECIRATQAVAWIMGQTILPTNVIITPEDTP